MDSCSQILFFLTALFSSVPKGFYFYIWHKISNTQSQAYYFDSENITAACNLLMEWQIMGYGDVYIGATPCVSQAPKGHRPGKQHCAGLSVLWADIDVAHLLHTKLNLPPDYITAYSLACSIGLPPSFVVYSGHGLHAWWCLDQFWQRTMENMMLMDNFLELCKKKFQSNSYGYHMDSVWDSARVMRIPGTVNRKDPTNPIWVCVCSFHSDGSLVPLTSVPPDWRSQVKRYTISELYAAVEVTNQPQGVSSQILPMTEGSTSSYYYQQTSADTSTDFSQEAFVAVTPASTSTVIVATQAEPCYLPPAASNPPSAPVSQNVLTAPVSTFSSMAVIPVAVSILPASDVPSVNFTFAPNAIPDQEAFNQLWSNNKKFQDTWNRQRPDLDAKDNSQSVYDLSLANMAYRAGLG
jgi:hypothetical protein